MSEDKKGYKLFIGGLSVDTDNASVQEYFSQFGETEDCRVMRDPNTDKSRGFGFVTFTDKSNYDECLAKKDHEIDGKVVEVKVAVPRNELGSSSAPRRHRVKKVFLGGLSPETNKQQIIEALEKQCGEGCVAEVQIMTEKETEKPRGFGFAIMKDPQYSPEDREYDEAAYEVVDKLVRDHKFIKIGDRDVEVKPARSLEDMRREEETKVASRSSYSNYSGNSYGYGSARDMMYPPRNMYDSMRGMPSSYYGGTPYDYLQSRSPRDYPMSGYSSMSYDRTGASAYGYDSSATGAIDYTKYYYSGMMGSYPQTASSYGPAARSYGDYKEKSDRGDSRSSFHPYSRR